MFPLAWHIPWMNHAQRSYSKFYTSWVFNSMQTTYIKPPQPASGQNATQSVYQS